MALLKAEGVARFRDGELFIEFAPSAASAGLVPLDKLLDLAPGAKPKVEATRWQDDPDAYAAGGGMPIFDDEAKRS